MTAASVSLGSQRSARPTWEIGASVGLHLALVLGVWLAGVVAPESAPLIDPTKVMRVQAVALPKQTTTMPDRPSRTPDPPKGEVAEVVVPPPPPTASDMVLEKEDTPKAKGSTKAPDRTDDRQKLLNQAKKEALLKDMQAPLGTEDRTRTSPDGVDPSQAIFGAGSGEMDPELARYIAACRDAILPNWTPLPATIQKNPGFTVELVVPVSSDGKLGQAQIAGSSGDSSFDRSALMAVAKTGKLPPPPARFRKSASAGVSIVLAARDLK